MLRSQAAQAAISVRGDYVPLPAANNVPAFKVRNISRKEFRVLHFLPANSMNHRSPCMYFPSKFKYMLDLG
jgi:hypothetical protein